MSNEINIELDDALAEGTHTNLTVISHSGSEFVLDFIRLIPGTNNGKVKSRIVLTPEQAKRLVISLEDNINQYETTFGEIKVIPTETELQIMSFGAYGEA